MKTTRVLAAVIAPTLLLSACAAGSLGSSSTGNDAPGGSATVNIRFLIPSGDDNLAQANAVVEAFQAENQDVRVQVETRPGGTEGDNLVKTRLATSDMSEVFQYNSGSLLAQISPESNLVDLSGESWTSDLVGDFKTTVTVDDKVYGSPWGTFSGGGVLYNKRVYEELGLQVPLTWREFMANNEAIKQAGKVAVIGTYSDSWTSQLFVLGDFHNVAAVEPQWANQYTANEVTYSEQPALRGFEHLQEVAEGGYMNTDFNAAKLPDGLDLLATGEGVHFPMLTFVIPNIALNNPDHLEDLGFFALPGDDAATNGATVWSPSGNYIPVTATGDQLDAAKRFVAFWATPQGCQAQLDAAPATGPWAVTTCTMPDDVPGMVKDLQAYTDAGNSSPALEFLSPVKGPALEQITVEVGSGIRSAADGAALYDEDVKKQAEQLGLPGW